MGSLRNDERAECRDTDLKGQVAEVAAMVTVYNGWIVAGSRVPSFVFTRKLERACRGS